jgi:hypothetical protein
LKIVVQPSNIQQQLVPNSNFVIFIISDDMILKTISSNHIYGALIDGAISHWNLKGLTELLDLISVAKFYESAQIGKFYTSVIYKIIGDHVLL